MLIFSQNKRQITECKTISVTKNIGGKKEEKFVIVGSSGATDFVGSNILASFPDEKTALDALEKAFTAFENGAKSYRF